MADRRAPLLLGLLVLAGCDAPAPVSFQGHGEADYVHAGPVSGGRLLEVPVRRGDSVAAGDMLFALDDEAEAAALAAARARREELAARLDNLLTGRRVEEIAVLEADRDRAAADHALAAVELERRKALTQRKVASESTLDQALALFNATKARLAEADARIVEARLPARSDEIAAARQAMAATEAEVVEAEWRLAQRRYHAPAAAKVEDVLHEPGEMVAAGAPVVALLPDGAVFVRFYVPEPMLGRVRPGADLALACSGCADGLRGRVRFVSTEVEFAPPLIFSQERQDKLVYMAEAEILGAGPGPLPGQPVTVAPAPEGPPP